MLVGYPILELAQGRGLLVGVTNKTRSGGTGTQTPLEPTVVVAVAHAYSFLTNVESTHNNCCLVYAIMLLKIVDKTTVRWISMVCTWLLSSMTIHLA